MQLTLTADGSHTLQMDGCDEHYHSTEGAVEEARHVYLRPCFHAALNRFSQAVPLALFEMGFGTGLNALLTRIEAERLHRPVSYTAVELNPLDPQCYTALNYPECLSVPATYFLQLHDCPWNSPVRLSPWFTLCKYRADIRTFPFPFQPTFHAVYYDAFAPQYQPQLCTSLVFDPLARSLFPGALLTTYCCKGDVKRALQAAGFLTHKLPGYGRKREMLCATMPLPHPDPTLQ